MGYRIKITAGDVAVVAELNDSPTAEAILAVLPVDAEGNRLGDEIYFRVPVEQPESEDGRAEMEIGSSRTRAASRLGSRYVVFTQRDALSSQTVRMRSFSSRWRSACRCPR